LILNFRGDTFANFNILRRRRGFEATCLSEDFGALAGEDELEFVSLASRDFSIPRDSETVICAALSPFLPLSPQAELKGSSRTSAPGLGVP
jgi:hypothetical protein